MENKTKNDKCYMQKHNIQPNNKPIDYKDVSYNPDFGYEDWYLNGCFKAEQILNKIKPLDN